MSRKGECLDNAVAESFFGTLKTELVTHEDYRTKEEARKSLYIGLFYNRRRRHSFLGYISQVEFEASRLLIKPSVLLGVAQQRKNESMMISKVSINV